MALIKRVTQATLLYESNDAFVGSMIVYIISSYEKFSVRVALRSIVGIPLPMADKADRPIYVTR